MAGFSACLGVRGFIQKKRENHELDFFRMEIKKERTQTHTHIRKVQIGTNFRKKTKLLLLHDDKACSNNDL